MGDNHPTFSNPAIQEALCEIHYRLPEHTIWKPALFGEFFKRIQPDFPELEPVVQMGVQLLVGQGRVGQELLPPQQQMRYKHGSRPLVLQLSQATVTVNELPIYPGWARMRQDILSTWSQFQAIAGPASIDRVGLRYINRFERTRPDEPAVEWLAASDYLPMAALQSMTGFLSRLEVRLSQTDRLIVTLGDNVGDPDAKPDAIVFDIDRIREEALSGEESALGSAIDHLHEDVWRVFSESMTLRLRERLERSEP